VIYILISGTEISIFSATKMFLFLFITYFSVSHILIEAVIESRKITLISGPFHGKVVPSESSWVILPSSRSVIVTPSITPQLDFSLDEQEYKPCILMSLQKGHGHQEIWATVLNRDYLIVSSSTTNDDDESD
jgi:hypothetical protein